MTDAELVALAEEVRAFLQRPAPNPYALHSALIPISRGTYGPVDRLTVGAVLHLIADLLAARAATAALETELGVTWLRQCLQTQLVDLEAERDQVRAATNPWTWVRTIKQQPTGLARDLMTYSGYARIQRWRPDSVFNAAVVTHWAEVPRCEGAPADQAAIQVETVQIEARELRLRFQSHSESHSDPGAPPPGPGLTLFTDETGNLRARMADGSIRTIAEPETWPACRNCAGAMRRDAAAQLRCTVCGVPSVDGVGRQA